MLHKVYYKLNFLIKTKNGMNQIANKMRIYEYTCLFPACGYVHYPYF
jgi:hypothetical protein